MLSIIGTGSVALLLASKLRPLPNLVFRTQNALDIFRAQGCHFVFCDLVSQSVKIGPLQAQTIQNAENLKYVILATKAYQVIDALQCIKPRIGPESVLLFTQNGLLAVLEKVEEFFAGTQRPGILVAANTHGAYMKQMLHVKHSGLGNFIFGPVTKADSENRRLQDFAAYLTTHLSADFRGEYCSDADQMAKIITTKVAVNACINPLAAILNVPNGEILQHSNLVKLVAEETAQILGLDPDHLLLNVQRVCRETARNRNSMLADIERRQRTEIDFINGWLARKATRDGVPGSHNQLLAELIAARSM